jgi:hypothetical protein
VRLALEGDDSRPAMDAPWFRGGGGRLPANTVWIDTPLPAALAASTSRYPDFIKLVEKAVIAFDVAKLSFTFRICLERPVWWAGANQMDRVVI